MNAQKAVKPPTQVAGVQGFNAFEAKPDFEVPAIDWAKLIHLPPFQMFMVEVKGMSPDFSLAPDYYTGLVCESQKQMQELYDQYADWHEKKGYWPNEDPMGCVI